MMWEASLDVYNKELNMKVSVQVHTASTNFMSYFHSVGFFHFDFADSAGRSSCIHRGCLKVSLQSIAEHGARIHLRSKFSLQDIVNRRA